MAFFSHPQGRLQTEPRRQFKGGEPILFWVGQCGNAYVRYNLKKLLKMLNTDRDQKAKIKVKKSDNFEQFQIHRCCIQNL